MDFRKLNNDPEIKARSQAITIARSRRDKSKRLIDIKVNSMAHTNTHWVFVMRIYYGDDTSKLTRVTIKK